jgi:hypothetical protein
MQASSTVRESRRVTLPQEETPRVDFRERCDEARGRVSLVPGEYPHLVQQLVISELRQAMNIGCHIPL